jgi:hypothetical protein
MELEERMKLTTTGQVTWADPEKGMKCSACKHIKRHPKPRPFRPDQCGLVWAHMHRQGEPLDAKKAIACSKFEM